MPAINLPSISVVLNIHREAKYLRPTLLSLHAAAHFARNAGHKIEMIAVFDRSDDDTRAVFRAADQKAYSSIKAIEVDNGNLALSRNDGIENASGDYVIVTDADDLLSCNCFVEMAKVLKNNGPKTVAFYQFMIGFDASYWVSVYRDLSDISVLSFLNIHPFGARVMAPRELFLANPYQPTQPLTPFQFEDWHFNAECVADGCEFIIAKNTVSYYRQRPDSLMDKARQTQNPQIAPTRLFEPERFLRIGAADYSRWRAGAVSLQAAACRADEDLSQIKNDVIRQQEIDPAIDIEKIYNSDMFCYQCANDVRIGATYYELCNLVRDFKFNHVFILPCHGSDARGLYIQKEMVSLYKADPLGRTLVILGEYTNARSIESEIPPNAIVLNLGRDYWLLKANEKILVALKLIQSTAPDSCVHVYRSFFGDQFLKSCKRYLTRNKIVQHCGQSCDGDYKSQNIAATECDLTKALSRREAQINHLEGQIATLQRALQAERERFATEAQCFYSWFETADDEVVIRSGALSLPQSAFRAFAKMWKRPWKRRILRIIGRVMGGKFKAAESALRNAPI